jgi:hypothetical protein
MWNLDLRSAGLALLIAAFALLVWWGGLGPANHWGDDWAGYLLQARAIVDGTVDAELAANTVAMQGSDVQIGPYAYPWGYPVLLAAAGVAGDWNPVSLKVVGGLSLAALVLASFALARSRLGLGLSAFVAIAVGLQPEVVVDANFIGSDVPFTAISTVGLLLVYLQYLRIWGGRVPGMGLAVAVIAASGAAFAIRSNGVVLPCTYVALLMLATWRDRAAWRTMAWHALGFVALIGLLFVAYFAVFPDGSLVHAGYLSFDPRVWVERSVRHIHYVAEWITFKKILGVGKLLPLGALLALMLWGLLRRPWDGAVLAIYCLGHLGLLTLFPFDGGLRYYHPLLPAAFMLAALGAKAAWDWFGPRLAPGIGRRAAVTFAWAVPLVMVLVMSQVVRGRQLAYAAEGPADPSSPATAETLAWVASEAPPEARVAFFKPRAFRLLSGRLAYAINQPSSLGAVDWYVFNGGTDDTRTQIAESALQDPSTGFRVVFERPPYRVYAKRTGGAVASAQANLSSEVTSEP